jgi:hypothetical protein
MNGYNNYLNMKLKVKPGRVNYVVGSSMNLLKFSSLVCMKEKMALYLDGENTFNPYLIKDLSLRLGFVGTAVLKRIRIARASTYFQMHELITKSLEKELKKHNASAIVVSSLVKVVMAEALPRIEALALLHSCYRKLEELAIKHNVTVIVTEVERPAAYESGQLNDSILYIDKISRKKNCVEVEQRMDGVIA